MTRAPQQDITLDDQPASTLVVTGKREGPHPDTVRAWLAAGWSFAAVLGTGALLCAWLFLNRAADQVLQVVAVMTPITTIASVAVTYYFAKRKS